MDNCQPPIYYKLYKDYDSSKATTSAVSAGSQLRPLPPPVPPSDIYILFGEQMQLHGPIPKAPNVIPVTEKDIPSELLKLNHSMIFQYLEILEALDSNPESVPERVANLKSLFQTAFHYLNAFVPHMAKEYILNFMRQQESSLNSLLASNQRTLASMRQKVSETQGMIHESIFTLNEERKALIIPKKDEVKSDSSTPDLWNELDAIPYE